MMKRWLLFIFWAFGTAGADAQLAKNTSVYNEEGKLQMLISYNPGCECRTYTEFYLDGKTFAKRTFKITEKGEFIDGEDITYYKDGTVKQYKLWKNAFPEGRAYTNYEDGKLKQESFYAGKYKTGTWKFYDKNGALIREQIFPEGKNLWNSKHDDMVVKHYKDGKLLNTENYKKGKLVKSGKKEIAATTQKLTHPITTISDGKELFTLACATCHAFDKDGFGPSLKSVTQKRTNDWLHKMITNGMKLVEAGDKDAVALYNQYNKQKHLNREYLTHKQVQAIIDYMKDRD